MTFEHLVTVLNATGIPFAETEWRNAAALKTDYGVYDIDSHHDLMADGRHSEKMLEGTVDLFTRDKGTSQAALIEAALDSIGCPWRLNYGPQYERETGYTHYEWVFNILP